MEAGNPLVVLLVEGVGKGEKVEGEGNETEKRRRQEMEGQKEVQEFLALEEFPEDELNRDNETLISYIHTCISTNT